MTSSSPRSSFFRGILPRLHSIQCDLNGWKITVEIQNSQCIMDPLLWDIDNARQEIRFAGFPIAGNKLTVKLHTLMDAAVTAMMHCVIDERLFTPLKLKRYACVNSRNFCTMFLFFKLKYNLLFNLNVIFISLLSLSLSLALDHQIFNMPIHSAVI